MTDDEIRTVIRAAISKHLGEPTAAPPPTPTLTQTNISVARYFLPRAEDDTMCLIEPAVRCNHCGYCQCHGH